MPRSAVATVFELGGEVTPKIVLFWWILVTSYQWRYSYVLPHATLLVNLMSTFRYLRVLRLPPSVFSNTDSSHGLRHQQLMDQTEQALSKHIPKPLIMNYPDGRSLVTHMDT